MGGVVAQIGTSANGTTTYAISGGFDVPSAATSSSCTGAATSPGCCWQPPADAATTSRAAVATFVGAGTITVKDGATTIATMTQGQQGAYDATSETEPALSWMPGDTLSVSASGGAVTPFAGSLVTVVDVAGVTPPLSAVLPLAVSVSADFVLRWTPGPVGADDMTLTLTAVSGTRPAGTISCGARDSDGALTVPAGLLSRFPPGATGTLSLQRASIAEVSTGNATVVLASQSIASGAVKLSR